MKNCFHTITSILDFTTKLKDLQRNFLLNLKGTASIYEEAEISSVLFAEHDFAEGRKDGLTPGCLGSNVCYCPWVGLIRIRKYISTIRVRRKRSVLPATA